MVRKDIITIGDFPQTETGFVIQGNTDLEVEVFLDIIKETHSSVIFDAGRGGSAVSPLLTKDGVLYFGACDHNLYALDAETGKEIWRFATQGPVLAGMEVLNGIVLGASYDGFVYAFDIEGRLVWKFNAKDILTATPKVYRNRIYLGAKSGVFYCLDMDGRLQWKFIANGPIGFDSCGLGDAIYFGSFDYHVYSIDLEGRLRWKFAAKDIVGGVFPDRDRVYFGSFDKNIYSLDESGRLLWKSPFPDHHSIGGVLTPWEGNVYFGTRGKNYYSFTRDGKKIWTFGTNNISISNTVFDKSGRAYFASGDGNLYCVDSETGKLIWRFGANSPLGYIAKSGDILLTSAYDGNVFGIDINGNELWRFHTSLDYPAPLTIQKEVMHTVTFQAQDLIEFEGESANKEKDVGDYGDFKGNYIQDDMRDYIGKPVEEGTPGMKYQARKKYR